MNITNQPQQVSVERKLQKTITYTGISVIACSILSIFISVFIFLVGFALLLTSDTTISNSGIYGYAYTVIGVLSFIISTLLVVAGIRILQRAPHIKGWAIFIVCSTFLGGLFGYVMLGFAVWLLIELKNMKKLQGNNNQYIEEKYSVKMNTSVSAYTKNNMTNEQQEAWRRVRNAGMVLLIYAWIGAVVCALLALGAFALMIANIQIPNSENGDPSLGTTSSIWFGVLLLAVVIMVVPFVIANFIGAKRLRQPVANPRGWLIYMIVCGALGATSINGIIELIFAILALSSLHSIDGTTPPTPDQLTSPVSSTAK